MIRSGIAKLSPVLLLALCLGGAAPSNAAVPAGLTQQGRILDAEGEPVNAKVTIVFTIYDDPEASEESNILWQESQTITLEDGYFSTRLGEDADNRFPADLFDGSVRYLGVKVGSDDEMTPRQRIGSVPYAFMANDVVGDIHPTSVTVNGKTVIDKSGNWVGNAVDRPFTSLLSIKSVTEQKRAALTPVTVTCDAGQKVTGGGCHAYGLNTDGDATAAENALKSSYPNAAGNGWTCACKGEDQCDLTAYAICARD